MPRSTVAIPGKQRRPTARRAGATQSRAEIGTSYELTQTVLDNMGEGVALFDRHLRVKFINRQLVEFQNYPAELAHIGVGLAQILRFQTERGDFGRVGDMEAAVRERIDTMRRAEGDRYERRTIGFDLACRSARRTSGPLPTISASIA